MPSDNAKKAPRRAPPGRVLVAWCSVCGCVTAVAVRSDRDQLPETCPQCPSHNWPAEDHSPYLQDIAYDLAPKAKRIRRRS